MQPDRKNDHEAEHNCGYRVVRMGSGGRTRGVGGAVSFATDSKGRFARPLQGGVRHPLGGDGAGISKGLFYARGLIEAYGKQGVKPVQLDLHLVLHGEAAQFLLIDNTYQKAVGDPFAVNLNAKITQDLLNLGVHVEICHSVMKAKGWTPDDVLPGVTLVHDGYTRLIKLQNDGYAYIGGF
ncbi:DsrE family protein [Thiobacillus denitrificans]|uniref:DsrE family protein n=1 Tax=Thiobacillus denitrificans TaxID=36861 RepID=UPI00138F1BFD|nr:DsrE family protein [Thiobacillus denitrificans]